MGGFIGPFVAVIARDRLHASPMLLGLMMAAPFIGNLFALFWANAMEGKSKLPFVVFSMIASRSIYILMVFAVTPGPYAAIIFAASILSTIASPAYAAVMNDVYAKRIRGRAMGYARVCTVSAHIVAVAVAGPLLYRLGPYGYRWVFPVAALVGIYSSLIFKRIKTSEVEPVERTRLREFLLNSAMILRDDRPFRWFALSIFTAGFGTLTVLPLYPIFQVDTLHITTTQVSVIANVGALTTVLAFLFWGPFIDKRTPLKGAAISVFLITATPLTYAFARHWTMLLPAAAIQGVANAGVELSYFNTILRFSPPERVSHYQAVFVSLLGVRGTIAPLLGTALMERNVVGMQTLFLAAAALCLVSVALQVYGTRTHTVR